MQAATPVQARILIVDDQQENIDLLIRIFNQYETLTAYNGLEALQLIQQEPFDAVILDIMMPEMGGIETLEKIRTQFSPAELPVILVSALSERRGIANGIRMGANDYIVKPFDVDDVTARLMTQIRLKQFADERTLKTQAFEQMVNWQERLMQVASHDLRNPMNNLQMLVNLMKKTFQGDPNTTRLLQMAETSLNTMTNIIEEFLDIKISATGNLRIDLRPTDTFNVITQICNQYAVAAFNKDIRIHAADIQGIVLADPNRLSQVIGNLVSNAIKYSPEHSDIWLETISANKIWQLSVSDSGPGVAQDERHKLFEPFSGISNKPTGGEVSTGLGLWIVREMMHAQNGEVGVHFPSDGGSQFWIQLEIIEDDAELSDAEPQG